jgi:putative exosortase-associated protein (TIGR04073 family)
MRTLLTLTLTVALSAVAFADLSLPKKSNFYDQMGRGIANIVLAPAEILDSTYQLTMEEGPTVGLTKGLVQGTSRGVMDICIGVVEVVTSPLAPVFNTESFKFPAYDSGQKDPYPPADLIDNWY